MKAAWAQCPASPSRAHAAFSGWCQTPGWRPNLGRGEGVTRLPLSWSCLSDWSPGGGAGAVLGRRTLPLSPGSLTLHGPGCLFSEALRAPCPKLGLSGALGQHRLGLGVPESHRGHGALCAGVCPGKWHSGCLPTHELIPGQRGWQGTGLDGCPCHLPWVGVPGPEPGLLGGCRPRVGGRVFCRLFFQRIENETQGLKLGLSQSFWIFFKFCDRVSLSCPVVPLPRPPGVLALQASATQLSWEHHCE